jgi:hypothetical protein
VPFSSRVEGSFTGMESTTRIESGRLVFDSELPLPWRERGGERGQIQPQRQVPFSSRVEGSFTGMESTTRIESGRLLFDSELPLPWRERGGERGAGVRISPTFI